MKRESIYLKVNELSNMFKGENKDKTNDSKAMGLYHDFIKWLDDNGAIYFNHIEYPVAFGPLGVIGCKAKCDIGENTALLFIPKSLIISSDDYLDKSNQKENKEPLTNGLKLTMILIDEYIKGKESFWSPYLSLILSMDYSSFPVYWSKQQLDLLNDQGLLSEIEDFNNEIDHHYTILQGLYSTNTIPIEIFKTIYLFTISRLFYLTDNTSLLIPLADLLNHHPDVDVKYEIFDSVNYTTKHTAALDNEHMPRNMAMYTQCKIYYDYIQNKSITDTIMNKDIDFKPLDIDINIDENIALKRNDYFIISTNSKQFFNKDNEIYNNYGKSSNQYLLVNFGFCMIDNYYDFSKIQIHLPKNDKEYTEMITKLFTEYNENDDYYSYLFRVKKRKINVKIIDFFRTNHQYSNSLPKYVFNKDNEIEVLKNVIDFYTTSIAHDKKTIEEYLHDIPLLVNQNKVIEVNINIFKMTQKINLLYQKEYLEALSTLIINSTSTNNSLSIYETIQHENHSNIIDTLPYHITEPLSVAKTLNAFLTKWTLIDE